jgi:response regulator of citrate/malate metabolism
MDNTKKILVIDNENEVIEVVTSIIKDISTIDIVHSTSDVESAMNMLKNEEYCAILGNVNLCSSGGVTCVDLIKEAISGYGDRYYNKIIVMSPDIDKIVEALRSGAYMSIIKPLQRSELRRKLSIVVDLHLKTMPPPKGPDGAFK